MKKKDKAKPRPNQGQAKAKDTAVYEVLIPCSNDNGAYDVGDAVTAVNFSRTVILNWCEIVPPVLRIKGGK